MLQAGVRVRRDQGALQAGVHLWGGRQHHPVGPDCEYPARSTRGHMTLTTVLAQLTASARGTGNRGLTAVWSQCNARERLGCFPRGKRAAIVRLYPVILFSCVHCLHVSIPPAVRPILLPQTDMGPLTCTQICGTGGPGTNSSAQKLTRRDRKVVPHPVPPGDRTQGLRIAYPTLTTELHPPSADTDIKNTPGGSPRLSKVPSLIGSYEPIPSKA